MTKNIIIAGLSVLTLVFAVLYFSAMGLFGAAGIGPTHYQAENFLQGLYAGTSGQFSVSNTGALTSSGANTLSGATTFSGNTTIQQSASSSLYIGGADYTGCLVLGSSVSPTSTSIVYITATGATISATTTKPSICR